jgi:hypothetical protein
MVILMVIYLVNSDMNRLVHGTWYYFYQTLLLNLTIEIVDLLN